MRGRLGPDDNARVLTHLVRGCPRCQEITAALWWAGSGRTSRGSATASTEISIGQVLDRVRGLHAGLAMERTAARRLLEGLSGAPVASWGARIAGEIPTWGLCETLLDRSRDVRAEAPRDAEAIAACAVAVAGAIRVDGHQVGHLGDLAARSWIAVAEARRVGGDLDSAEEALRAAEAHLVRGSGERLEKARLLGVRAALRCAQERYPEAGRLLYRALVIYRRAGQADLLGRTFVQLGYVRTCAGDLPGAAVALRQGLALADAARDPRDPDIALAAVYILSRLHPAERRMQVGQDLLICAPPSQPDRIRRR